ncbi:MAG: hypothetical protein AB1567_07775 [bacterium]
MPSALLEKIRKETQQLTPDEQLSLVERLIHQLRETSLPPKTSLDIGKLYGLGKGLCVGEDAQEYVNQLRENRI